MRPVSLPRMSLLAAAATLLLAGAALAKLPPLSEDAKAKAEEAKAKAAWSTKVAAYETCKAEDRAVANYAAAAKKAGKDVKPSAATPPCTDPGPFAYTPPAAAPASAASAAQKS
jgi:hypothetical protein